MVTDTQLNYIKNVNSIEEEIKKTDITLKPRNKISSFKISK